VPPLLQAHLTMYTKLLIPSSPTTVHRCIATAPIGGRVHCHCSTGSLLWQTTLDSEKR
jgi:hypothetical protein